ncbi:MAG TPA: hypothetical protein VI233_00390, partial [Puia sp.]
TQGNPMPSTPTTPIPPSTQNKTSKKTISLKNPTKPLEPSTTSLERSITSQESLTNPVESPTPPPSNISAPKEITLHLPALANLKNKQPIKAAVPKSAKDSIKNKKTLANIDLYASPDNSYNLGARLLIPIGKNLALITGFQYTSINHSKAHLDSAYRRPVNRLIEVPVLFAYTRQIKPTTNVGIHTGLILSNETSLYLGLHLERRLDPHFSFFAEPYYRYRLSGEQLSPLSIAVSFGLRYAIKK